MAELKKTLQYNEESQITVVKSSSNKITNFILQQLLYSDIHNNILKVWLPKSHASYIFSNYIIVYIMLAKNSNGRNQSMKY